MSSKYPASAGSKVDGASRTVAKQVDADPLRKLNIQIAIVLDTIIHGDRCIDEVAVDLNESYFYMRPRASELVALGVIAKGSKKTSDTHGRTAHTLIPSVDLAHELQRARADLCDDADGIRIVIRRFILDRVMDAKINGGVRV